MIITLIKKQSCREFVEEMEMTYKSLEELEKTFSRTNNMKMYVDLQNWKYYLHNPDEVIKTSESVFI